MSKHEYVIVDDCQCIYTTKRSIRIRQYGREAWIPQRCIHDDSECYALDTSGTLIIPRWLADNRELEHRERGL